MLLPIRPLLPRRRLQTPTRKETLLVRTGSETSGSSRMCRRGTPGPYLTSWTPPIPGGVRSSRRISSATPARTTPTTTLTGITQSTTLTSAPTPATPATTLAPLASRSSLASPNRQGRSADKAQSQRHSPGRVSAARGSVLRDSLEELVA